MADLCLVCEQQPDKLLGVRQFHNPVRLPLAVLPVLGEAVRPDRYPGRLFVSMPRRVHRSKQRSSRSKYEARDRMDVFLAACDLLGQPSLGHRPQKEQRTDG